MMISLQLRIVNSKIFTLMKPGWQEIELCSEDGSRGRKNKLNRK